MIGRKLAGRYEIIERIGEGGMSIVYRGHCHVLNRSVAIKILKSEFVNDAVFVKRFDQEAKAAASIQHANIVNVYDVGVEDDVHYIVMELVSPRTLKDYIKEQKVYLNTETIVRIGLQIAEALQVAHDKGIVHRDIKPQNILMTEDGNIKVADFGIARAVTSSTMVNTKEAIGSVHYSSPEQSRAGYVDKRSDIYSLGILLYELATGRVPFSGDTPIAVALKHLKEQPIPPHLINIHLNPALETLILKCITKDPINRYQNIYEIIERFETLARNPNEEVVFNDVVAEEKYNTQVLPDITSEQYLAEPTANGASKGNLEINGEDEASKKIAIKPIFVGAAALGVIIAVIILFATFSGRSTANSGNKDNQSFELINIERMNYDEALQKMEQQGLSLEITEQRYSDTIAANTIISQRPKAGTMVKAGQNIVVIVSRGTKTRELPNLQGRTLEESRVLLSNVDAKLGAVEEENSSFEKGQIILQMPASGTVVKPGTVVNVVVSLGPEIKKVTMPDIKGKTKDEALQILTDANLMYGAIDSEYSDTVELDKVISQSVVAGTEIDEETIVNFVISLGVDPATVSTEINIDDGQVTKTFRVPLSNDKAAQAVEIKEVVDGGETSLYGKIHRKEEGVVVINITGKGTKTLRFYVDGTMIDERVVEFSGE